MIKKILFLGILLGITSNISSLTFAKGLYPYQNDTVRVERLAEGQWTKEKANKWYNEHRWLVGCNYIPRNAINQLEMWQESTYDPEIIKMELGWASGLGFNTLRVYLHDILWEQDSIGFINRIDNFLDISEDYDMKVMFVLLDGVWNPLPLEGKQPDPIPHVHNSGWVQSPGKIILEDTLQHFKIERYIKGVIGKFSNDKRILAWDIFNEPDNENESSYADVESKDKASYSLGLLKKAYKWAREAQPAQPLTSAVWKGGYADPANLQAMDDFMLKNSDIISFHQYDGPEQFEEVVNQLEKFGRPLMCTEYMARGNGSTFTDILPILKKYNIAAYNWGLVSGKSQTIYPWDSWDNSYVEEPKIWFHDIYYPTGKAYSKDEISLIKNLINN